MRAGSGGVHLGGGVRGPHDDNDGRKVNVCGEPLGVLTHQPSAVRF